MSLPRDQSIRSTIAVKNSSSLAWTSAPSITPSARDTASKVQTRAGSPWTLSLNDEGGPGGSFTRGRSFSTGSRLAILAAWFQFPSSTIRVSGRPPRAAALPSSSAEPGEGYNTKPREPSGIIPPVSVGWCLTPLRQTKLLASASGTSRPVLLERTDSPTCMMTATRVRSSRPGARPQTQRLLTIRQRGQRGGG